MLMDIEQSGYDVTVTSDSWQEGYWEGGRLLVGRQILVQ